MPRSATEPLPGAPDPWAPSGMPGFRSRPPYLMTEMIAAEPALAQRLVHRLSRDAGVAELSREIADRAGTGRPVLTTGCGTSEHAAMGVAELLNESLGATSSHVMSVQALETLRRAPVDALVIGISHEGGTAATNEALRRARDAGSRTALITVSDRSPGADVADIVVTTEELDRSWCHTVGYLAPLIAGAVIAARMRDARVDGRALRALLDVTTDARAAASAAAGLTGIDRLVTVGYGVDFVSARELALKVSEGARLPAQALDLETVLHGHLAAATRWTGLVLVATDVPDGPARGRIEKLLAAAAVLGMPTAAILSERSAATIPETATPAGRLVLPRAGRVRGVAGALLGVTVPLQLLAERLARARGVDPDTLGREDPAQASAHA